MNARLFFGLVLSFILSSCGPQGYQNSMVDRDAVIGGQEVRGDHSLATHVVGLIDPVNGSKCTGTVIAEDLVLTAAHCVFPASGAISVYFSTRMPAPNRMVSKQFLRHAQFQDRRGGETHDLALIRLPQPLPASHRPVNLDRDFNRFATTTTRFLIAGFGVSNRLFGSGAGVLRMAQVSFKNYFSATEFATPQGSVGVCSGDSGGPIFINESGNLLQVGVASRTNNSLGPCSGSAIYTRVDRYEAWIQETAAVLRRL